MSAAAPTTPATPGQRPPQPAAPRGRPQAPTIDPIRVLRQHAVMLAVSAVVGAVVGVAANYLFLFAYPLWGGNVIFEIRPEVTGAKDAVTREIVQD